MNHRKNAKMQKMHRNYFLHTRTRDNKVRMYICVSVKEPRIKLCFSNRKA